MDWGELTDRFAAENGLTYSESHSLLREIDYDPHATKQEFEARYRRAAAVWEALNGRFGFHGPFPVQMPLPRGNRVYHKLMSLSLQKVRDTIRLNCSTEYISKPGTWADKATTSISHDFLCLPDVKDLTAAFEHWAVAERQWQSERIQKGTVATRIDDEDFFYNPSSWTLHDFLDRRGASIRKAGLGSLLTLNMGCLGYAGATTTIYLLSKDGHSGTIITKNRYPGVDFDVEGFRVGDIDDPDFSELPELTDLRYEFAPHS